MSFGPYYCKGGENEDTTDLLSIVGSDLTKVPNTDSEFKLKPVSNKLIIDVVNDFCWTSSPVKNSNKKIPILQVTELAQKQNSLVSSALYYINALLNTGKESPEAKENIDYLLGLCTNQTGLINNAQKKISNLVKSGADPEILGTGKNSYLQSYIGMYITEKTGFKYSFPFFEGKPHSITNSWQSSTQTKSFVSNTLEKAMDWVDTAAANLNFMTPGTYIEKPKYFQYPGEGESITITFPLLNTIKKSEKVGYQQNYELLWILAYQNKPFRTSFSRILPPKLYTLTVPGMKYMPYTYISNMSVDFLGTTRLLPVSTPKGVIDTSIPEAYNVSLTFTSMLADIGNLMISQGFQSKITVKTE